MTKNLISLLKMRNNRIAHKKIFKNFILKRIPLDILINLEMDYLYIKAHSIKEY